jgi:hypothetical protein
MDHADFISRTGYGTLRQMIPSWLDLLDDTMRFCAQHDRADLMGRLRERRDHLLDRKLRILVVGEPGQGKSQLINALVNAPVCAVGDDLTTRIPAIIEHSETPTASIILGPDDAGRLAIEASAPERIGVPVESATAQANREASGPRGDILRAQIGLPRELLATGLVLIDTPAGAPDGMLADAVVLASDATCELTAAELALLGRITRLCPTVLVAMTKIDLAPDWRRIAERNRTHLAKAGVPATVVPVSATLRLAAARTGDRDLNTESGFGELVHRLRHDWLEQAELLSRRSVAALAGITVEQLSTPLHKEFAATQQTDAGEAVAKWHAAGKRMEALQHSSTRWQTLLNDEVADLMADMEFDLRDRTRRIIREVDEYFDAADPARTWEEFEDWLLDQLTAVAETNFGWQLERFEWIAAKVARQIAPGRPDVLREALSPDTPLEHVDGLRKPTVEKFGISQKLFVGMRGSYGGLLMFGLATSLAGLPLINPISLGAGAAFGAKSVFEERGHRLKRRQAAGKTAAQRHVDDFFLSYGKDSKDTARLLHRALRDRFSGFSQRERAEISESAKAIKQVIDDDVTRRTKRAHEIKNAITELGALRQRVRALAPVPRGLIA